VAAAILAGAASGTLSGLFVASSDPALHRHAGHDAILKGLSLVISGTKPIYSTPPRLHPDLAGLADRRVIPALPIPNGVLILFLVALAASFVLERNVLGRFTFALGSTRRRSGFRASTLTAGRSPSMRWPAHLRHRGC